MSHASHAIAKSGKPFTFSKENEAKFQELLPKYPTQRAVILPVTLPPYSFARMLPRSISLSVATPVITSSSKWIAGPTGGFQLFALTSIR